MAAEVELYDPGVPADLSALDRDGLVELGRKVAAFSEHVTSVSRWVLGDLANQVETSYGESELLEYAAEIGAEWSTLRDYAQVSRAFPATCRLATNSWTVYRTLAAQPDRLELASRGQPWTVQEARELRGDRIEKERRRRERREARERKKAREQAASRRVPRPGKAARSTRTVTTEGGLLTAGKDGTQTGPPSAAGQGMAGAGIATAGHGGQTAAEGGKTRDSAAAEITEIRKAELERRLAQAREEGREKGRQETKAKFDAAFRPAWLRLEHERDALKRERDRLKAEVEALRRQLAAQDGAPESAER